MRKLFKFIAIILLLPIQAFSAETDANTLFLKLRTKLDGVKDYVADVRMKVNVSFMRVPPLSGKLYFKAPDKMKLDRTGGISIMPRKSISMTLNALIPAGEATVIDAGYEQLGALKTRVLKVVPANDRTDIVLTKIWVDEERLLAMRTETTTRDNGTVKMDLQYAKYLAQGLPDHVTFLLDVKDYKLPKGVTMDYDNSVAETKTPSKAEQGKSKKGKIEITYLHYEINKGIPDEIFIEKKK